MSSDMSRKEAIEVLKDIVSKPMLYSNHIIGACRVALASLETDEAYQLEYESKSEWEQDHAILKAYSDHNAIIIPQNATNGDVIKAMFSVVGFTPLTWHISSDRKEGFHVHIENCFKDDFRLTVSKDWWNIPYKETTTRNCFGCKYSKDNHNAGTEECHLCMWENQYTSTTKNNLAVEKTDMIDKSNFSQEQYKTDLQSAYDCGYAQAKNDLGVDAVRRKAVLNTLDNMDSALDDEDRTVETYKELLKECYKVLPSVTPQEPRKGMRWIGRFETHEWGKEEWCECPWCHMDSAEAYNFCPNCGADFREDKE